MTQAIRQWLPTSVSALGVLVAGLVVLPLLYILTLALSAQAVVWSRLWQTRIPELLSNTAWLAIAAMAHNLARAAVEDQSIPLTSDHVPLGNSVS